MKLKKLSRDWLGKVLVASLLSVLASKASAIYDLSLSPLSNGYEGCTWQDNGNGTSTLSLRIRYKSACGHTAGGSLYSRGIIIYFYDKNGMPKQPDGYSTDVFMGGYRHSWYIGERGYTIFYNYFIEDRPDWQNAGAFTANVKISFPNEYVRDEWPAISVRAGNLARLSGSPGFDYIAEISGAAYFVRGATNGSCSVVDPERPPPPALQMSMTAPDWNLGELPEGDGEKVFVNGADQLCFTYTGAAVNGQDFVINASSANGEAGNRYRLRHAEDASQFVPYNVELANGSSIVSLPNKTNMAVPFGGGGRTCFVPTFKTTVSPDLKEGDYSDVLLFEVITKP